MRIYLAGPMSGLPDYNYPAFHAAAARLRDLGHKVINPAENFDGDQGMEWTDYLRSGIAQVVTCEAVAVLPGWRGSKGATLEVQVAEALGMPVLDADTLEPDYEDVALEAHRITNGARQAAYGHPLDNFTLTGRMWEPILGVSVSAEQVAMCMTQLKIAREINAPKRDNRTDAAGYVNTLEMIVTERARRDAMD